jgi:hypothetical protein
MFDCGGVWRCSQESRTKSYSGARNLGACIGHSVMWGRGRKVAGAVARPRRVLSVFPSASATATRQIRHQATMSMSSLLHLHTLRDTNDTRLQQLRADVVYVVRRRRRCWRRRLHPWRWQPAEPWLAKRPPARLASSRHDQADTRCSA